MASHKLISIKFVRPADWAVVGYCLTLVFVVFAVPWAFNGRAWLNNRLGLVGAPESLYVDAGMINTLLELIPATVLAAFVFAAGSVFVIAQLIGGALGSRAVLALLTNWGARAAVTSGMMLLVLSLALAATAPVPVDESLAPWVQSAAATLAVSTVIYVAFAVIALLGVVQTFVDPRAYRSILGHTARA